METVNSNVGSRNIDKIIHKYAKTGTATRRMDGVIFKLNKKAIEVKYISGLNCTKKILNCPVHKKIYQNNGDSGDLADTSI